MAIESFSGIWSLNTSNPVSTDDVATADDHLRGIKSSIRQSFPEISATVNVSHSELNHLSGVDSNIKNNLDAISTSLQAEITRTDTLSASLQSEIARVDTLSSSLQSVIDTTVAAYGGLTIAGGTQTIFSASASLASVDFWTAGMPTSNVTVVTASGSLSPDVAGDYVVSAAFSFSGAASTQYECRLYRDNVATNYGFQRFVGTGADVGSAAFTGVISSGAGQEFKVRIAGAGDGDDLNAHYAMFSMVRISSP